MTTLSFATIHAQKGAIIELVYDRSVEFRNKELIRMLSTMIDTV
jgi:hypothetical protein